MAAPHFSDFELGFWAIEIETTDMRPTDAEIDAYLNLLIPTAAIENECPICHEPYPDYTFSQASDYPAWPYEHSEGAQCRHIFGRLCIEQHVRGGEEYSTRCPSCREEWIRFPQGEPSATPLEDADFDASSEFEDPDSLDSDHSIHGTGRRSFLRLSQIRFNDGDELEDNDDLLRRMLNRRMQAMRARRNATIGVRLRRSSISRTSDDGEREVLSVPAEATVAPEDRYPSAARRLERVVTRLERMRVIYEDQRATAGVLLFLENVEHAVEGLSVLVEERDVTES